MAGYNLLNGYVGSKAPYISKIKALFDSTCTKYVEPYVGGGAVYFSNYNGKYEKEWVNDANPCIANLYISLANNDTRDDVVKAILAIGKSEDEMVARELFRDSQKIMKRIMDPTKIDRERQIEWSYHTFRAFSQSFNCGGKNYSKKKSSEKYLYETRRNLLNAVERLKTITHVTCWDGMDVIKKVVNKPEVQLFVDWPYVGLYRNRSNLYGKEMASLKAHIEGARMLKDGKAAVVMCDYRSQIPGVPTIYDAIFSGDEWHCFKLADTYKKCMVVRSGEAKQKATEYVWTNRVPENAGLYLLLEDYKEKLTEAEYWDRIRKACLERRVPDKHILEYHTTYKEVYEEELFDICFINEVKKKRRDRND